MDEAEAEAEAVAPSKIADARAAAGTAGEAPKGRAAPKGVSLLLTNARRLPQPVPRSETLP